MITRPLAALLALSLLGVAAAQEPTSLVTRSYDVSQLAPDPRHDAVEFPMLPFDEGAAGWADELDLEELAYQLVQDVVAPDEFQYEGRALESYGEGALVVTAPPEVHAEVARFLDGLAASFHRRARVELSVERLVDGLALSQQLAGMSPAELRAAGLTQGGHRQVIELDVGQTRRVRSERRDQVVRRWDAEIAQASTAVVPVTALLRTGLDMLLRLEADFDGGFRLRSVGRVGAVTRRDARRVAVSGVVFFEGGVSYLRDRTSIDDLVTAWTAFSGAAHLRPGESTHQLLWTRTQEGAAGWSIGLRLLDVAPAPEMRFGENVVRVSDLSTLMLASQEGAYLTDDVDKQRAEDLVWLEAESGRGDTSWADHDVGLRLTLPTGDGSLGPVADEALNMLYERDGSSWLAGNWLVLWGPADGLANWEAETFGALSASTSLILELGVDGVGRSKTAFDGPQARLQLELQSGDELTALVGDARNYVSGFETDVANSASVRTAHVSDLLDGLLVRASSSADLVQLDVDYGRLLGWNPLELENSTQAGLDRPSLMRGSLSARLRPDGARQVLGELSSGADDGVLLRVWARLRADVAAN